MGLDDATSMKFANVTIKVFKIGHHLQSYPGKITVVPFEGLQGPAVRSCDAP